MMNKKIAIGFFLSLFLIALIAFGQSSGCYSITVLTQKGGGAEYYYTRPIPFEIRSLGWRHNTRIASGFIDRHGEGGGERPVNGQTRLWYSETSASNPLWLLATGRRGGCVAKEVTPETLSPVLRVAALIPREDVIGGEGIGSEIKPPDIPCEEDRHLNQTLPAICPLLASARLLYGLDDSIDRDVLENPDRDYLNGCWDPHNNPPSHEVWGTTSEESFDGRNVLAMTEVTFQFDWEDAGLRIAKDALEGDYLGIGIGGVYANFHYSVMPYDPRHEEKYNTFLEGLDSVDRSSATPREIALEAGDLMRCVDDSGGSYCNAGRTAAYEAMQYLTHLGDRGLWRIGREEEAPPVQYHGLLQGGFFSKRNDWGDQCEVLDTRYQAPVQRLKYKHFGIWDWDAHPEECLSMIVWEGDSSWGDGGTLVRNGLGLESTVHLDDFAGYFKICRDQLVPERGAFAKSATVVSSNFNRGLTIKFQNQNTQCP